MTSFEFEQPVRRHAEDLAEAFSAKGRNGTAELFKIIADEKDGRSIRLERRCGEKTNCSKRRLPWSYLIKSVAPF